MKIHDLDTDSACYNDILNRSKPFEIVKDEGYEIGDMLWIRECTNGNRTGYIIKNMEVTYILRDSKIKDGYCIIGMQPIGTVRTFGNNDRNCSECKHRTLAGCSSWDCHFESRW